MHPLVRGAAAAATLTALGSLAPPPPLAPPLVVPPAQARGVDGMPALCGPRTVPDGDACVPLPAPGALLDSAADLKAVPGGHNTPRHGWETYDEIPRRPERPADHAAYAYPVGTHEKPARVLSNYDLDLPGTQQRQGPGFKVTGHGGIDLAADRGATVSLVALEHQDGDAEVVFAGELFGTTVATSHAVREAGRLRQYVVLYGHLERAGVAPGAHPKPGEVVGLVGDTGSPGIVHLHLEVRQVREGVTLGDIKEGRRLVDPAVTVPCDPRNVFPLAG